ncbi:MAG: TPM domain-containing protein, partial [Pseudoxanthomonas sp.]
AEAAFARLRVWDTERNNGVLIYLLLADHRIEIVADRGLTGKVSAEQWRGVCALMEERMQAGEPEQAVVQGVEAVSDLLAGHFPQVDDTPGIDELPNRPLILD